MMATPSETLPTSLSRSKLMCMPDSMIMSVTPMFPMKDQMLGTVFPACHRSQEKEVQEVLAEAHWLELEPLAD